MSAEWFNALLGSSNPGFLFWRQNAFFFHDYLRNTSAGIGDSYSGDLGMVDVGPNGINGTLLSGTVADNYILNDKPIKGFLDQSGGGVSIPNASILPYIKQDHEVFITHQTIDGQGVNTHLFGAITNSSTGRYTILINPTGLLVVQIASTGGTATWTSTSSVIPNNQSGVYEIRIKVKYGASGSIVVEKYRESDQQVFSIPGSFTTGNITSVTPSTINITHDFYIGSLNNIGTATTNTNRSTLFRIAMAAMDAPTAEAISYFRNYDYNALWKSQIHVTSSNYLTKRSEIIDFCFNGGGLPANATPASTSTITSGNLHGTLYSSLTGFTSIVRKGFTHTDSRGYVWTHYGFHIMVGVSPSTNCMFYIRGHSDNNNSIAINRYLALGYDVVYLAPPRQNETATNTTSWGSYTGDHSFIFTGTNKPQDFNGYNAHEIFLFDKIMMMNYIKANFSYSHIWLSTFSAGAWTAAFLGAMDTRFEKTGLVRGTKGRIYKTYDNFTGSEPDGEQGGAFGLRANCGNTVYNFYSNYTYEDLVILCASDGRLSYLISHTGDTAGFGGTTYETWKSIAQQVATSLGGDFLLYLNTDGGEATHSVYLSEVNKFLEQIP